MQIVTTISECFHVLMASDGVFCLRVVLGGLVNVWAEYHLAGLIQGRL